MFSFTDDVILDPFLGSGTTCRAAKDLGRRSIGIDIDPRFCGIATERCQVGVVVPDGLPTINLTRKPAASVNEAGNEYLFGRLAWARTVTRRSDRLERPTPIRTTRSRGRSGS
jgi:hypothetical protein